MGHKNWKLLVRNKKEQKGRNKKAGNGSKKVTSKKKNQKSEDKIYSNYNSRIYEQKIFMLRHPELGTLFQA